MNEIALREAFQRVKEDMDALRERQDQLEQRIKQIEGQSPVLPASVEPDARITPAERRVLSALSETDTPLEYSELARRLDLNVITIRRYINNLVRYGFPLLVQRNLFNRNVVSLKKEPSQ